MHKPILLLIVFCASVVSQGQVDIRTYVKENTVPISTVEAGATDNTDLEMIGKAIGESRIIMMGEQDHGDAPSFLAKARLVKYLHEKKGFNVLAFESDFFGLNEGWDKLEKSEARIDSFLRKNIFGIWSNCDACKELFYTMIPRSYKTGNPIVVTGFDNQMYLDYSLNNLTHQFDSVLRALDLPVTRKENYASYILPKIDIIVQRPKLSEDSTYFDLVLDQLYIIRSELRLKLKADNFWSLVMDSFIQTALEYKYFLFDYYKGNNARDLQMARNLQWLCEVKFPQDKIIVWAHNYHISKYGGNYTERMLNAANTMGTEFTRDSGLNKSTYILGFTSNTGTAGRIKGPPVPIQKAAKDGFESWIDGSYEYAFVDLKTFNRLNPNNTVSFSMKGSVNGVHRNLTAQWTHIFDGVFYVKNMYRCNTIE